MGHKHSRHRLCTNPESSNSAGPSARPEPLSPAHPFRFVDRKAIPDDLVQGPFEDFEICMDVYSTAYLIARNATPEMYSCSPIRNPQVRIVWAYLFFVIFSQLFVILAITVWYPPAVDSSFVYADCSNVTSFEGLRRRGFLLEAHHSSQDCREAGGGEVAFVADVQGVPREFYKLEIATHFYDAVLTSGSPCIQLVRVICCIWVFSQVYLQNFSSVTRLLNYNDFSQWYIPVKGQTIRNRWAICLPLIQYFVMLVVTVVSFVIICSMREAFDIVLNSLAFTFITEVGSYFNEPLAKRMADTEIDLLEANDYPVNYLYPEYREENCINPDGSYTDAGWYILEDERKAGLLTDYRVRHNPSAYDHPSEILIKVLDWVLVISPPLIVLLCALRSHLLPGVVSDEL
eukprot:TRINITY_DN81168_c0_g1_i1.p1 TRINITY_DN81168_c0_g1~~TRINITY_DN81168_c0_g1_i1.p1  ORF type:complete len:414 (+),score=54.64 TRINITY_DN81168_c0_g1_i1:39-1244(+)